MVIVITIMMVTTKMKLEYEIDTLMKMVSAGGGI